MEPIPTNEQAALPVPSLFMPHPNLSDEVNRNIAESEIEGGVYLESLFEGTILDVRTQHRWYTIVNYGRGRALIWGHPEYCPDPVAVRIEGSTWGGSMLKVRFIGRGMHLEFWHPAFSSITTSRVVEIRSRDQVVTAAQAGASPRAATLLDDSGGTGRASLD